jgi:lysophospholipase L1-like esterase
MPSYIDADLFLASRGVGRPQKWSAEGDSITAESLGLGSYAYRVRLTPTSSTTALANYAVAGSQTTGVLARLSSGLLASGAKRAFLGIGVNDIENAVVEATLKANIISIWQQMLNAGIMPLDVGVHPRTLYNDGTAAKTLDRVKHMYWRALAARKNGVCYRDLFSRLSQNNGQYLTEVCIGGTDALHPNSKGGAIGYAAAAPMLTQDIVDPFLCLADVAPVGVPGTGLLSLVDTNVDGIADPYFASGAGATYSITNAGTNDGDKGKWQRTTLTGQTNVGIQGLTGTMAALGWNIGDKIAIAYNVRGKADSGQSLIVALNTGSWGLAPVSGSRMNISLSSELEESFYFYEENTITSGSTATLYFRGTGSGYFEINRPVIINLTQIGLA